MSYYNTHYGNRTRFIDIPIHLEAFVQAGTRLASSGEHHVYEHTCRLNTPKGFYRWYRTKNRAYANGPRKYACFSEFLFQFSDDCSALDDQPLRRRRIDWEDYHCKSDIWVIWDPKDINGAEEVTYDNWSMICCEMERRITYWDLSGIEGVSFYVKRNYTPIEHHNLPAHQRGWTPPVATLTGGGVISSMEMETERPDQDNIVVAQRTPLSGLPGRVSETVSPVAASVASDENVSPVSPKRRLIQRNGKLFGY